jgi:hypothetical protein
MYPEARYASVEASVQCADCGKRLELAIGVALVRVSRVYAREPVALLGLVTEKLALQKVD